MVRSPLVVLWHKGRKSYLVATLGLHTPREVLETIRNFSSIHKALLKYFSNSEGEEGYPPGRPRTYIHNFVSISISP